MSSAPHVVHCPCDSRVSSPSPSVTSLSSFCHLSDTCVPSLCHHTWHVPVSHPSLSPAASVHKALVPLTSPFTSLSLAHPPVFSPPCLQAPWSHTHFLSLPLVTFPSSVPSESQIPVPLPPSVSLFANPVPHSCSLSFPLASPRSHPPHRPVSPGEKPYVCTVPGCGKRFTEYSSLYKHHVVHTHCKPYTCSTCGKTYRQTSTLAMHKRSAHGELEATEESEQALYEQQQLEGEGRGQEVRVGTSQASP